MSIDSTSNDIFEEVDTFPPFDEIEHGSLFSLSLSNKTNGLSHGIHRFSAKYIPQIPRWAIKEFCTHNSIVLDPFVGSGTTIVEASLIVDESYGVDIDPLARLISKVKTTSLDIEKVNCHLVEIKTGFETGDRELCVPMPDVENFNHWFRRETWQDLQSLLFSIDNLNCSDEVRDFYWCVFSSIVRAVSNADDQSQKTYVSGTLKKKPASVRDLFWQKLKKSTAAIQEYSNSKRLGSTCQILEGTAQNLPIRDNTVDLIVTSPPYLDSVDYMYNFMLEYFWLGKHLGINSRDALNAYKKNATGAKNPHSLGLEIPELIGDLVDLDTMPKYRKKSIPPYFIEMERHFREASRVLKPNGRYILVIGNSNASQNTIPVHDCLIRLAQSHGLVMEKTFGYRIRRHYMKFPRKGNGGIILIDWVITLRKSGKSTKKPKQLPMPKFSLGNNAVAN